MQSPHCLSEPLNCPAVTTEISISLTHTHATLTQPCYVHVCVGNWRPRRARTRVDRHKGDPDLWWHWSSVVRPGRTLSWRSAWLHWKAEDHSCRFLQIYTAGPSALTASTVIRDTQHEFSTCLWWLKYQTQQSVSAGPANIRLGCWSCSSAMQIRRVRTSKHVSQYQLQHDTLCYSDSKTDTQILYLGGIK